MYFINGVNGGGFLLKEENELLQEFQCDINIAIEEKFAEILSEKENVRVFFINENQAFTDGKSIVLDPAIDNLYKDYNALINTENWLKIDHELSSNAYNALKMITRSENIHESLHLIFTNFPIRVIKDKRASTKARSKALSLINNIIEDAFIEAAGCSLYDNLELYLLFGRVSRLFCNTPSEGTVDRAFSEMKKDKKPAPINLYLNYMATLLLYPMIKQSKPNLSIRKYVRKTKDLFYKGSITGNPDERYKYSQEIFDIIEKLIPKSEDMINEEILVRMLGGIKTHSFNSSTTNLSESKGRAVIVTRRLFTDLDGNELPKRDYNELFNNELITFTNITGEIDPIFIELWGDDLNSSKINSGIKIIQKKPIIKLNMKRAYNNIYQKYKININSYNTKFSELLKAETMIRAEKLTFGSGISSKRMGDVKKRYWYKNTVDLDVPSLSVMLLIDGSGSMEGERRESAIVSSLILHEVLKNQKIEHSIIEHRAIYDEKEVIHNILVDFNCKEDEKYNIMSIDADGGTREGLSLLWADKYIKEHSNSDEKLIIVLSDGCPCHVVEDENYYIPPVSIMDTKKSVNRINRGQTKIIAVALDNNSYEEPCYEDLKLIYPNVVSCTDLNKLTGQLLELISKELRK